jgi:thioester reductase-like protein
MAGVIQFYEGQNIFVTGATGFLGKVLLEKLLRACPDVGNIFVLVRPKKGKEPSERVQHITSLPVITKDSVLAQGVNMFWFGYFMSPLGACYPKTRYEH